MNNLLRIAGAAAAPLALPVAILAQAQVSALATGSDPLESTDQLRLSRFADFSEVTMVAVGTELEPGDLLTSLSEELGVELACGENTVLLFSGGFRLLIEDAVETDCAVDLLSGSVDAVSDSPAEIGAGDVTLGVEGTQFSLTLTRTEEGPDRDLAVFEGKVRVRSGSLDEEVETGRSWRMTQGQSVWGQVTPEKAERTASLFARLDVAKTVASGEQIADRQESYKQLRALHYAVLTEPGDSENRVELARAQLTYKRDSSAAYHLKRADVTTEEQLDAHQIDRRVTPYLRESNLSGLTRGDLESVSAPQRMILAQPLDPYELIRDGDYERAIEILEPQARSGATARIYCGLARAHAGLEGAGSRHARTYAARAMALQESDGGLSRDEALACRRLQTTPQG